MKTHAHPDCCCGLCGRWLVEKTRRDKRLRAVPDPDQLAPATELYWYLHIEGKRGDDMHSSSHTVAHLHFSRWSGAVVDKNLVATAFRSEYKGRIKSNNNLEALKRELTGWMNLRSSIIIIELWTHHVGRRGWGLCSNWAKQTKRYAHATKIFRGKLKNGGRARKEGLRAFPEDARSRRLFGVRKHPT